MLGCVAVAPDAYRPPIDTHDSGDLGGNMDFNGVSEGATVFLQVNEPGALLYLGDAHARQGDGELNGNALETSMDIEFTVAVERDKSIDTPRVENDDYIMTMGLSGSLDNAFRIATSGLAKWLQADYKLTAGEAAMVLGTSIEYNISEVADRNVGVVAKIRKSVLSSLPHAN
jgi:amidase